MPKFDYFGALHLGLELLEDLMQLVAGQASSFEFSWRGRKFTVSINPQ